MSASDSKLASLTDATPTTYEWTAHPARERPWVAAAVLVAIAVLPAWMVGLEESFAWSLFAAVVLLFSLHRFFFASYYEISDSGMTSRTLLGRGRVAWGEVRSVEVGRFAAWISAARGPGWRESRRGVLIQFGRRREDVLMRLRDRIPEGVWTRHARRA